MCRYLTLTFLKVCLIIFLIVAFTEQVAIANDASDGLKSFIAFALAVMLETTHFLYVWLLPLKIAKDITGRKLRSFSRIGIDPNSHSFVGTVVGTLVGATYIVDTVLFSNLNFLFQNIALSENFSPALICLMICTLLAISIGVLYKEIYREWRKIPCIKKRFPRGARSYTVARNENEGGMYSPPSNQ